MFRWITEIRAVGIIDWVWFVFWLGRDEFNPKLDLWYNFHSGVTVDKMYKDRKRAHRIDMALEDAIEAGRDAEDGRTE